MPDVAGYYQINGCISHNGSVYSANIQTSIAKNGSVVKQAGMIFNTTLGDGSILVSALIYLNGSTDYIGLYGYNTQTGPFFTTGSTVTYFQAFLARSA
jgi:hypothetical protein